MAVTGSRLNELRAQFEPTKKKIDEIDRKYSLDYVEPTLDMPESLNLPPFEYEQKSEQELLELANERAYSGYLSAVGRLQSANASNMLRLDKQLLNLEQQTRQRIADLITELNKELSSVNVKITNAGMLFSTTAERYKMKLRHKCEGDIDNLNAQADVKRQNVEAERSELNESYGKALLNADEQRQADVIQAYNNLLKNELAQREKAQKYNNLLSEKETKYQMARAKALENARQAEYERSYKAKKLYQEMGATGYEENMLWEKYNVLTAHFVNFTKREEALALIQYDSYVRGHLKQFYTTFIDWINRNVPA